MEKSLPFIERYIGAGTDYLKRSLVFLIFMIIIRFVEIGICKFDIQKSDIYLWSILFDFIYILQIIGYLIIPFLLLYFFSKSLANVVYISITSILIIGEIAAVGYFRETAILIGSDVFAYNKSELIHILETTNIPWIAVGVGLILLIAIIVTTHWLFSKIKYKGIVQTFFFSFVFFSMFLGGIKANQRDFKKEYEYYLAENKLRFFLSSSFDLYINNMKSKEMNDKPITLTSFSKDNTLTQHKILNSDYPFFHKEDSPDVLSPFMNDDDSLKPNILFIIVESLGSAYSGNNNQFGSFTSFLDSLSTQGLYWNNFVSSAGRTFQVLPTMLASLPFGETGFDDLCPNAPNHLSLPRLLKKNGYTSSFFYGGDATFDNMKPFLQIQKVDNIVDGSKFGKEYKKMPSSSAGASWGYGDKELFDKYLSETKNSHEKRFDVLLTMSMHSPFSVINQIYFENKVEQRIAQLKLNKKEADYIRLYKTQFATIMYFDDALKHFINELSKRESFKNTIIVLTGDHRMPEIPISTQIDRFHVPLLIYSPMIKKPSIFNGISSQYDITPSIISMLRNRYKMNFPLYSHWIGFSLDTSKTFCAKHIYPFMRNKNEMMDFIVGTNFLSNTDNYDVDNRLGINISSNALEKKQLIDRFEHFKQINHFTCKNNKLIPDSLYLKW